MREIARCTGGQALIGQARQLSAPKEGGLGGPTGFRQACTAPRFRGRARTGGPKRGTKLVSRSALSSVCVRAGAFAAALLPFRAVGLWA
eukprot:8326166-Alexandrium_andersonii.AAC.1